MTTIELESEVLQVSRYCEIITQILTINKEQSLVKLVVFAYLLKNQFYLKENIYRSNTSNEIVYKCLSALSGQYEDFVKNIQIIIESLHLLKIDKRISISDKGLISLIRIKMVLNQMYDEDSFIYKAIKASRNMSDRQFLKEVTNNV